jgi:hypothetical protein
MMFDCVGLREVRTGTFECRDDLKVASLLIVELGLGDQNGPPLASVKGRGRLNLCVEAPNGIEMSRLAASGDGP